MKKQRLLTVLAPLLMISGLLTACGGDDGPFITVYNAQHQELLEEMAPIFEKETGIEVKLRNGKDFELANQIVAEGKSSPADVFLTENSPAMSLVESKPLFAPVEAETLAQIREQYRHARGQRTGLAARPPLLPEMRQ